ncbi:hypothetical protein JHK87_052326 [Glycine soja]|nr:hypothetical protein JHK87_052326 [Glycine soja]
MNPNRDGIEGPLIAEPEANHGESVTPSNDAQIAPLQRLSFQMSILLKLAKVSDLLALLQPIRRLQDLHLNLHRFPRKAKHYLRWIIYLSKLLPVCHKPSWLTVDIIFNLRLLGLEQEWKKESCLYLLLQPVPPPDMKECPIIGGCKVSGLCLRPGPESFNGGGRNGSRLGVEISVSKSLVSQSGAAEFAKRFRVKNITYDLSPVSIRNLLNSHHLPGTVSLLNTYGIKRFSTLARLHFSFMPLSGKLLQFSNKWKKILGFL